MGASGGGNTIVRTIIPVMLTLLILGIFLSLYFLKYIPGRQSRFNDRAYMELQQIAKAVQRRDNGYVQAIRYFLNKPQSSSPLFQTFKSMPRRPDAGDSTLKIHPATLIPDLFNNDSWQLSYPLVHASGKDTITMSTRLDSLLIPLIATYRDIFSSYLLISRPAAANGKKNILFNSDNLPLGNEFDPDTLQKKSEGLNPLYIHDINIEGTPYKLFLYPLEFGTVRTTLAGLISASDYSSGYKDIPLNLFVPAGIIILLLIICLPILKIFILGAGESITDWNIRLIVGSYFVAAFTCFFLFSWLFLTWAQSADDRNTLRRLSRNVQGQFMHEIDTICLQLRSWDSAYQRIDGATDPVLIAGLRGDSVLNPTDSQRLDQAFHADLYPYTDYAFWIDSSGQWVATLSGKTGNNKPLLLRVDDRDYFKDFVNHKYLNRPGSSLHYTIQPTLSRLDGEYTITVVIESMASPKKVRRRNGIQTLRRPMLVGLSAQMYSVTNTVLPQGYNFSIIDENGVVLYDSKPGRALLSNIQKESEGASAILECARFRNHRYFSNFQLRGREVALEVTPMEGLPYTLLTYSELSDADHFQIHVIGLSAIFTMGIVMLLILSTIINEWTGKKPGILLAPPLHFEWLRPRQHKRRYYLHLVIGLLSILLIYIVAWGVISSMPREEEFSLFFITVSLPFYVSLYYYTLREKEKRNRQYTKPLIPIIIFFSLLLVIQIWLSFFGASSTGIPLLSLAFQALFFVAHLLLVHLFTPSHLTSPLPGRLFGLRQAVFSWSNRRSISWLRCYSLAIVIGVFVISVVPACGIFWLFIRQETGLRRNSDRLEVARTINARRLMLNKRMAAYKFADTSEPMRLQRLRQLKFDFGIYLIRNGRVRPDTMDKGVAFYPMATQYVGMHDIFFPGDTNVLAGISPPDSAADGTWHFSTPAGEPHTPVRLDYDDAQDHVNPGKLRLEAGREASWSSIGLIQRTDRSIGALFMILFYLAQLLIVFLVYKLTRALATRIFLIDMFHNGLQFCYDRRERVPPVLSPDLPAGFSLLMSALRAEEKEASADPIDKSESILRNRAAYKDLYEERWATLSPVKKFVLFDMARDGFPNYRTGNVLFDLLSDRLLEFRNNGHLELITPSFREFVLLKAEDPAVIAALKRSRQKGEWLSFKTGLMILFTAFGLFIFFTQDALFQKMTGLLTSLVSITTQFSTLFDKTVPKSSDNSGGADK
jgi:hypothetical protein